MTDDIWYNELSDEQRDALVHDATVARGGLGGDASVKADGRRAAREAPDATGCNQGHARSHVDHVRG